MKKQEAIKKLLENYSVMELARFKTMLDYMYYITKVEVPQIKYIIGLLEETLKKTFNFKGKL